MTEENSLAEKIGNGVEDFSSYFNKIYSDEIGYIKILAITGSLLPIILAIFDGNVGIIALGLSFILILLALKKIDNLSKYTKSFKYMMKSFVAFIILGLIYIIFLSSFMSSWNYSIDRLFSHYLFSVIFALVMALLSTYFYYKSYIEIAKATGLKIFKIAAIMMIVSIFVDFISETLSSILIVLSIIFIIIGWYGIKTITSDEVKKSVE